MENQIKNQDLINNLTFAAFKAIGSTSCTLDEAESIIVTVKETAKKLELLEQLQLKN